jgi:hypothetical protein
LNISLASDSLRSFFRYIGKPLGRTNLIGGKIVGYLRHRRLPNFDRLRCGPDGFSYSMSHEDHARCYSRVFELLRIKLLQLFTDGLSRVRTGWQLECGDSAMEQVQLHPEHLHIKSQVERGNPARKVRVDAGEAVDLTDGLDRAKADRGGALGIVQTVKLSLDDLRELLAIRIKRFACCQKVQTGPKSLA